MMARSFPKPELSYTPDTPESPSFAPTSPKYSPTEPSHILSGGRTMHPSSHHFAPKSPKYSPTEPSYPPDSPIDARGSRSAYAPRSYTPPWRTPPPPPSPPYQSMVGTSPIYVPTSPSYYTNMPVVNLGKQAKLKTSGKRNASFTFATSYTTAVTDTEVKKYSKKSSNFFPEPFLLQKVKDMEKIEMLEYEIKLLSEKNDEQAKIIASMEQRE